MPSNKPRENVGNDLQQGHLNTRQERPDVVLYQMPLSSFYIITKRCLRIPGSAAKCNLRVNQLLLTS